MWKLACFTLKHTSENSLGSDSLCSVVNALYKLGNSLQGTLLGFLTKSASPRTPWFLLPCMGMTPHWEVPPHNTSFMESISLSPFCSFTAGTMQGNTLGVKMLRRHNFANKGPSSQGYGFSSRHVWMWELDYKESWAPKNWCFWTVVLKKTLESPLDCKEIKPVNPKGNQPWIFIERTDAEAEAPILWPPEVKNWLTGKDPDAGKDWRQE